MTVAIETTPCKTAVIHPYTKQVVVITGRKKIFVGRNGKYTMLRVTGGEYFNPRALQLAPISFKDLRPRTA